MIRIDLILEEGIIIQEYLISRNILDQYMKARFMILAWNMQKFDFKLRKPKNEWVYQFRINQKYRAIWYFRENTERKVFIVTKISDHQDF